MKTKSAAPLPKNVNTENKWPRTGFNGSAKHPYLLTQNVLVKQVEKGEIDTVLFVFPDMQGRWMGKRVTAPYFLSDAVKNGVHACAYLLACDMDMTPVPGYKLTSWEKGYGDFHLVPDWNTVRLLPWMPKTALVICDIYNEDATPTEVAPRWVLKRQIEKVRKLGMLAKTASELELYLFKDSFESAREKNYHNLAPLGYYIEDYHILQGTKEEFIIKEIRTMLERAGVPVEFSKGEWGYGQHEINLRYSEALEMADRHTVYKHGAKEIALGKGHAVTFMAKYDAKQAGSSFHLHSSLWDPKGQRNLFSDKGKPSQLFRWYLGGQLALAREFAYFFAPYANSYKRYQSGSFAPTKIAWGHDNRTCGFRIIGQGASLRVENRLPGADANPYLAFAATIAAGLYGIENKIEPPHEQHGNAYEAHNIPEAPKSLAQAAQLFNESKIAREALGKEVFEHYAHAAKLEEAAFQQVVTCWERERHFERS